MWINIILTTKRQYGRVCEAPISEFRILCKNPSVNEVRTILQPGAWTFLGSQPMRGLLIVTPGCGSNINTTTTPVSGRGPSGSLPLDSSVIALALLERVPFQPTRIALD